MLTGHELIDWCSMARQHKIGQFVPICQGGVLALAVEDSQRVTLYKTVACDTIRIHMQRKTTGMPYLLKDEQCNFVACRSPLS